MSFVDDTGGDLAGPAHHARHPEGALPVRVLLAAERRHAGVRPAVHVRPVVGGVHDERVVGDAELVEQVEQRADEPVVVDHRVVVGRLPAPGLTDALRLRVGAEVHVGGVDPHEERRAVGVLATDEVDRRLGDLVVDGLHALLGQRPGVLDPLRAVLVRPRVQDAAGAEALAELREVGGRWVVGQLRLLLGVEVVEVAEELVEAVGRRQVLVLVAEVVLAELAGGVAAAPSAAGRSSDPPGACRPASRGSRPSTGRCGTRSGR